MISPTWRCALVAAALLVPACRRADPALPDGGGRFDARWTGADTGAVSARAVALWCEPSGVIELRAVRGDTGFGVAVRAADSMPAGRFEVFLPDSAGPLEGRAAVAVRWFGETEIEGFQGVSGMVSLTRDGAGYSGEIASTVRSVAGPDTLALAAEFDGVPLRPAPAACAGTGAADTTTAAEITPSPDTGLP